MKASLNSDKPPERKLVATINTVTGSMYLPSGGGCGLFYISTKGDVLGGAFKSLEAVLNERSEFIPVYEGDTVTLQF